jgi:hypothetical protein
MYMKKWLIFIIFILGIGFVVAVQQVYRADQKWKDAMVNVKAYDTQLKESKKQTIAFQLTIEQLKAYNDSIFQELEDVSKELKIKEKNIIREPEVTVRLLNARVAVLGAVKSPHVVSLTSERNTVLDVLSQCGDVSEQALRKEVTLYREENGKRSKYHLDLTSTDIFDNPAFYVQQNDLIYVQPNKRQNVKSSAFSTFLGVGGSVISALASVTALAISIVNLTKK